MNTQLDPTQIKKKILVIDDHVLFREGLISLLRTTPDFEVVGDAGSVYEGIKEARRLTPEIILMDFSLPDGTGLDATSAILSELPECKVVFLTVHETEEKLFAALRQGASGYMLKNISSTNLISSLRALNNGEMALSRLMMSRAINQFTHISAVESKNEDLMAKLSPREKDVLGELESGATNQEIAKRLYLSENTVKHHIRSLLEKLGAENRYVAASLARQYGIKSKFPSLNIRPTYFPSHVTDEI
jgi:two-component system, NarL family, nitrate/nitrite response regulator NarL